MAFTLDKQPSSVGYSGGGLASTVFTPGASAQTPVFSAQTRQIRISNGSTVCWIKIDANPVASATDGMLIPSNVIDYISVMPGQPAAVFGTGGSCTITETW